MENKKEVVDLVLPSKSQNNENIDLFENEIDAPNCELCSVKKGKYVCPQCNIKYCSVKCFKCKKHENCSENFYKNLVKEELKDLSASDISKKKMLEILQRLEKNEDFNLSDVEEENDLEEEDGDIADDLNERMEGIDLNDAESVWEHLSKKEQDEFMEMIKNGKTDEVIPQWTPWWQKPVAIEEVSKDNTDKDVAPFMKNCPPIFEAPLLSSVIKVAPSPCIPFNIINTISGYVWMTHLFHGDHLDNCVDAAEALFCLCPVLSKGVNYDSAVNAVCATKIESQNYSWLRESNDFHKMVEKDVRCILIGPNSSFSSYYVTAALWDIKMMLTSCRKSLLPKNQCKPVGVFASTVGAQSSSVSLHFATKESMGKTIKKIEFYISFVKEYPDRLCKV